IYGDKHDHQEIDDREAQGQPKTGNDARLAERDTFHTRYPLLAHGLWRNGAGQICGNGEPRVFCLRTHARLECCDGHSTPAAQQSVRRIDLIEDAAVSEMHLLRNAPTAEYLIIERDELYLGKAFHIFRIGVLRMARPIVV